MPHGFARGGNASSSPYRRQQTTTRNEEAETAPHIPASFYRARIEITWPECSVLPRRAVRDRLNGEG
jgi:hypothetical protein